MKGEQAGTGWSEKYLFFSDRDGVERKKGREGERERLIVFVCMVESSLL